MRGTFASIALAALICTGLAISQDLRDRHTVRCNDGVSNEQLREIKRVVREQVTKWSPEDQRMLDLMTLVVAHELGIKEEETHAQKRDGVH